MQAGRQAGTSLTHNCTCSATYTTCVRRKGPPALACSPIGHEGQNLQMTTIDQCTFVLCLFQKPSVRSVSMCVQGLSQSPPGPHATHPYCLSLLAAAPQLQDRGRSGASTHMHNLITSVAVLAVAQWVSVYQCTVPSTGKLIVMALDIRQRCIGQATAYEARDSLTASARGWHRPSLPAGQHPGEGRRWGLAIRPCSFVPDLFVGPRPGPRSRDTMGLDGYRGPSVRCTGKLGRPFGVIAKTRPQPDLVLGL